MYVLFRYPVGIIIEGVILARGKNKMRVAARGVADTLEFKRSGKNWFSADRQRVELEFVMSRPNDAGTELENSLSGGRVMTFASAN
jgi:hypothetical protein